MKATYSVRYKLPQGNDWKWCKNRDLKTRREWKTQRGAWNHTDRYLQGYDSQVVTMDYKRCDKCDGQGAFFTIRLVERRYVDGERELCEMCVQYKLDAALVRSVDDMIKGCR